MKAFKEHQVFPDNLKELLHRTEEVIEVIDPITNRKYRLVEASLFEARKYPNWEFISRLGNMNELGITITESIVNQRIAKGEPYIHRTYNNPFTDEERVKGFITKHLKSIYPNSKVEIERCGVQTLAVKINFNDQGAE